MHPDFKNKGDSLGVFIEECGEALAAAGKTVRYGWASYSPLVPESERETNEEWLKREIRDVLFAISRLAKSRCWDERTEPVKTNECDTPSAAWDRAIRRAEIEARKEGQVPRSEGGNLARTDACDNVANAIRALRGKYEEPKGRT